MMTEAQAEAETPAGGSGARSDLPLRMVTALFLLAVAGGALWLGGWVLTGLIVAVGLAVLWEWHGLARKMGQGGASYVGWMLLGLIYIDAACYALHAMTDGTRWLVIATVIGVDVGAYFLGRAIGGPRIAPSISPSKTWAGLAGGIVGAGSILAAAAIVMLNVTLDPFNLLKLVLVTLVLAIPVAVVAQAGDFFESWMKRRAGVKDSGRLLPGHGGIFDRVDGLMPVAILAFVAEAALT